MITPIRQCFQHSPCRQLLVEAPSQPRVPATCICVSCMAVPITAPPARPLLAVMLCLQILLLHAGLVVACCLVGCARAVPCQLPGLSSAIPARLGYAILCCAMQPGKFSVPSLQGCPMQYHVMIADRDASPRSTVLLTGCAMPGPTIPHCTGFSSTEVPPLHGSAIFCCAIQAAQAQWCYLCWSMPCHAMFCHPHYVMLWCPMPRCAILFHAVPCCARPQCAILSHAMPYSAIHTMLCYGVPCHAMPSTPCPGCPGHLPSRGAHP